jgi:hypothetical protein
MITFRFYLVTLVAIFLSVALGVTIGSTFLEPALVQDLNNQVESVQQSLDERVERIDELRRQIDDLEKFAEEAAPFSVEGQLDGTVVLVAAQQGVDGDTAERLVGRLRQAGATTDGIVWLQPELGTGDDVEAVLAQLGLSDTPADDPDAVRAAVWSAVLSGAAEGVEGEGGSSSTTSTTETTSTTDPTSTTDSVPTTIAPTTTLPPTTGTTPPLFEQEAILALEDAGWISLEDIEAGEGVNAASGTVPSPRFAVVVVTGPEADDEQGLGPVMDLVRQGASDGVPTVVAEVWVDQGDEGLARGAALAPIRDDGELAALVSTVDDLDRLQGQVAATLAVRDLGRGIVGHYGYGDGADLVLPPWSGP